MAYAIERRYPQLYLHAIRLGYRVEVDDDGTERLVRPDGTVAIVAKPKGSPT